MRYVIGFNKGFCTKKSLVLAMTAAAQVRMQCVTLRGERVTSTQLPTTLLLIRPCGSLNTLGLLPGERHVVTIKTFEGQINNLNELAYPLRNLDWPGPSAAP